MIEWKRWASLFWIRWKGAEKGSQFWRARAVTAIERALAAERELLAARAELEAVRLEFEDFKVQIVEALAGAPGEAA